MNEIAAATGPRRAFGCSPELLADLAGPWSAILTEFTNRLQDGDDVEEVALPALYQAIDRDLGIDCAFSFRLGEDDMLHLRSAHGVGDEMGPDCGHLAIGQGISGTVAAFRRPIRIDHVQQSDDPCVALVRQMGLSAYVCEPVVAGNDVLGTLSFGSRSKPIFQQKDWLFFQAIAAQVALADTCDTARRRFARETQHHVKNMMSVVQSIAWLSGQSSGDVETFNRLLGDRLGALGRVQDLLIATDGQSVPLRQIIEAEIESVGCQKSVLLTGPDVGIDSAIASFIGIVVHELAANAVAHGGLSTREGRVRVEWDCQTDGTTRRLFLQWIERGGPPLTGKPTHKGFGARLLKGLGRHIRIERQFRAEGLEAFVEIALD